MTVASPYVAERSSPAASESIETDTKARDTARMARAIAVADVYAFIVSRMGASEAAGTRAVFSSLGEGQTDPDRYDGSV